jgi:UDP-glucose 4-epimerase
VGTRVLVTGASGFIGSHVVESLVRAKFEVTALVHYNGRNDCGWLKDVKPELNKSFKVVFGDITDTEQITNFISGNEVVINLAALIAIPYSYVAPRSYINTNLLGTLNILEAIKKEKANGIKLVQISTSEVYGTPKSTPILETHAINPQSPYAASKSAADQLCISYYKSFDTSVNILRPFNTFGPRQSMRAVIPTVINQFIFNKGRINVGSLTPKRDFTYVSDTAEAIVLMAKEDKEFGNTIQLGTGLAYSVEEVIKICEEISGIKAEIISEKIRLRPEKSEVQILLSDPSLAEKKLNWRHKVDFKEGLRRTFEWQKTNSHLFSESESYAT